VVIEQQHLAWIQIAALW